MTGKQIQEVQDEALRIYRDYAHLTFREAIAKAIKIIKKREEIENDRERI